MSKRAILVVGIFLLLLVRMSPAGDGDQRQVERKPVFSILPDLVIESMSFEVQPQGNLQKRITISYVVYNDAPVPSTCCPTEDGKKAWEDNPAENSLYRIRVEGRNLPSGSFSPVANGGYVSTVTKARERQTYTATEVVSVRARREYRVTLDYGNWIKEKKEDNNQMTKESGNGDPSPAAR